MILLPFWRESQLRAILPGNGFRMYTRLQTCRSPGHQHCTGADGIVYREKRTRRVRVHGGGFAGVIMAMIPNDLVDEYTEYIENAIGEGNVYRMSIRPHGAICVSERI